MKYRKIEHTWYKCTCGQPGCMFCDGGLGSCTVCGGFEGTLTTDCIGCRLQEPTLNAVWKGYIDFVDGRWRPGVRWQKGRLISWEEYANQLKEKNRWTS